MKGYGKTVLKFLIAALLATTALTAGSFAQSAPVAEGSFTLPFPAQWGGLNLDRGTYSFTVIHGGNGYVVRLEQDSRALGFILTSEFSSREMSQLDEASLLCVRHTGACSIGVLKMPEVGIFYFNSPGSSKAQIAQQPELIERLPVLWAKR